MQIFSKGGNLLNVRECDRSMYCEVNMIFIFRGSGYTITHWIQIKIFNLSIFSGA